MVWAAPGATQDPLFSIEKHIARGEFQQAQSALAQVPASSAQWHLLASKIYDGLGEPVRAVAEAEAALSLDPKEEAHHLQLGQIFLSRNTPQAAYEIFTEALDVIPGSLLLLLGKGLALKELMRYEEAETVLKDCLRRKPDLAIAFDALATVYLHAKRFEDTIRLADAYRQAHPLDFRGPYYAAAGRDGLKLDSLQVEALAADSVRLNPDFAAAQALLGKVRLKAGRAEEAVAPLERALALRPNYTPAALHLGQAYRATGRTADAEREFQRVRELNSKQNQPPPSLTYHRGSRNEK